MNEIRMYLKTSGSIAELYKDFNLFKGSYQNVLLSIYVPKSLLYENQEGTFSNVVKTGAILASQNGTKITTKSYYADYVKDIEINGIAYSVYSQHLPHEYVVYAGTQTVIANVVALDITDPNTPVVLQITTSQTAQLVIQESAYLADDDIIDPTDLEKINAQLDELQKNKLDKQTGVPSYPQVYAVEGNTQKLIPVSNGSTIAPNDRIAQYTSSGTLFTQPPEADSDTTNKGYVDGEIKKSNDEQMVINERIVEILDGIEIVKVNDLEYNLMVDETIKGTINIPKDQFLKSVSYDPETHVLTFIFLTSDGEVTTTIDMSSLVDVYQAGNGLTLANNTFSVKLDPSSNNALTLSAAGLMLDNTPLENALNDIEILNSDMPKSAEETGAFISGNNTLAGAKAEVEVQSENLVNWKLGYIYEGGIKYTQNSDGTVTANGTAGSDNSVAYIASLNDSIVYKKGTYVLSGCPVGGSSSTYSVNIDIKNTDTSIFIKSYRDTGTGVVVTVDEDFTIGVFIDIRNYTANNLVFKPKFQVGAVATPYTPYLSAGTAVEVQACGKNLLNPATFQNGQEYIGVTLTNNQDGTITLNGTSTATSYFSIFSTNADAHTPIPEYLKGKRITLSLETNGNDLNDCTLVTWAGKINNFIDDFSETKILSTTIQPDVTDWSIRIKLKSGQTYNNILYKIMVTFGEYAGSLYIPYKSLTYPAAVGETIEVEQYDRITNIFSNTTGAAVSTQFLQSTRYELDTKPVSLAGTYAERPTGTYPYVVLYTATDTGRTYRLESNTDGSVSSNWVNISSAGGTGGGFTPRGEWNSATTYNENDLVSLNGSSYVCIEENTNATPASNPDKWMVNAEKGATGTTGPAGANGTNGKNALMYNGTYNDTTTTADPDSPITLPITSFTRTPVVGDIIDLIVRKLNRADLQFFATYKVSAVTDSNATLTVSGYVNIKGERGQTGQTGPEGPAGSDASIESLNLTGVTAISTASPGYKMTCPLQVNGETRMSAMNVPLPILAGTGISITQGSNSIQINNGAKLYEHHISYQQSGTLSIVFTIIDKKSTTYDTTGDLSSYLQPQVPYNINGWYRLSSSTVCWGMHLLIDGGGKINCKFASPNGETSIVIDDDETLTDKIVTLL